MQLTMRDHAHLPQYSSHASVYVCVCVCVQIHVASAGVNSVCVCVSPHVVVLRFRASVLLAFSLHCTLTA